MPNHLYEKHQHINRLRETFKRQSKTSSTRKRIFFQKDGKSDHAAQCAKSLVLTKVIDTILYIGSFYQKFVILKGCGSIIK